MSGVFDVIRHRSRWTVIQNDCFSVLRRMTESMVDHVITDPPYSWEVHNRSIRRTTLPDIKAQPCRRTRKWDFGFDHLHRDKIDSLASVFLRIAKRWVLTFSDVETSGCWRGFFDEEYVRTCFWIKDRSIPQITGDRPASRVEAMVLAHRNGRKRWNLRAEEGDSNVWQYPVVVNCSGHREDRIHTAQKPIGLMMDLIQCFTDPDDVVLDPFAGSGTTGLACLRLGRRCILIEQKPEYAQTCIDRLRAEEKDSTLQAYRAGQLSLLSR